MTTPVALTIAGSDSGGGAGIQADLKTFAAFGVYGLSVITAVTAQNTVGVRAVQEIDPAVITAQLDAVAEDFSIGALKTGMLSSAAIIGAVVDGITRHELQPPVVDPVMVAKSGDRLLRQDAVDALRRKLLPRRIMEFGARAVVIKGGHSGEDPVVDLLVDQEGVHEYWASRIATTSTHGTGCTFAAAIAAALAKGMDLAGAVGQAREYLSRALAAAPGLGHGHGPMNHFPSVEAAHAGR
ncbi:MAG: bifunctional hydroxymethylpyrimidine kinase/phosphomethylpyrimidine kinase [Chloroflexi bacterium]|nr:MAG: bifunctional hydroxymethylpyrimidine kinase/phosphomethylpyrimidine kinase [Chloroflexota bacterium]